MSPPLVCGHSRPVAPILARQDALSCQLEEEHGELGSYKSQKNSMEDNAKQAGTADFFKGICGGA